MCNMEWRELCYKSCKLPFLIHFDNFSFAFRHRIMFSLVLFRLLCVVSHECKGSKRVRVGKSYTIENELWETFAIHSTINDTRNLASSFFLLCVHSLFRCWVFPHAPRFTVRLRPMPLLKILQRMQFDVQLRNCDLLLIVHVIYTLTQIEIKKNDFVMLQTVEVPTNAAC